MDANVELCPWCNSEITHDQFEDISTRIREEEKQKLAALQQQLELEATQRAEAEAAKRVKAAQEERDVAVNAAQRAANAARDEAVTAARREADEKVVKEQLAAKKLVEDAQAVQNRAVAAQKQSEAALLKVNEEAQRAAAEQIRLDRLKADEKVSAAEKARDKAISDKQASDAMLQSAVAEATRVALQEAQQIRQNDLKLIEAVQAERDAAISAKQLSDQARDAAIEAAKAAHEVTLRKEYQQDLLDQRKALVADHERERLTDKAANGREREALEAIVRDLQRKLENKTANEIGDGAQIELFDEIRQAFPEDNVTQIEKGRPGADIRHEIVYSGVVIGSILYDSKARQQWRNEYVTKLREDQMNDGADHAILSSLVFPRNKRELCIESNVVIVSPARAVYIATLLRDALIKMHVLGLSKQQQESKTAKLYEYIMSNAFAELLSDVMKTVEALFALDVDEVKAHENVWKKRGLMLAKQKRQLISMKSCLSGIIECAEPVGSDEVDAEPAAFSAAS